MSERGYYVLGAHQALDAILRTARELGLDPLDTHQLLYLFRAELRHNRRQGLVAADPLGIALQRAVERLYKEDRHGPDDLA